MQDKKKMKHLECPFLKSTDCSKAENVDGKQSSVLTPKAADCRKH